jgi:hypothetical protein
LAARPAHRQLSAGSSVDIRPPPRHVTRMIRSAGQYSFWYFGYPTPLAPAVDRSA